ncbi:spore cortex biosynthesis protein YabQ [Psychrobacillus sp. OK032]|uniref:spore cortex biosynthesis protein YabQ n=1 Tax=Psychrobacillus sp. OK032 TaxID=1884358 RepID=UPI0008C7214B|nr:Spore cortex protein YabQ (Spore_YabQ) [Psychrobacillus sp. OK032]
MTLSLQFFSLLLMILSGVFIGAIIEGTRFVMNSFPKRTFVFKYSTALEIIIWIVLGLGTFYILFRVRDGIWRIYDPLAQIVGILLYEQLFQPIFRFAGRVFLRIVIQPIWFVIRIIITIISKIFRLIRFIIITIVRPFHFVYKKIWHLALKKKPNFRYNKKYTKN